MRLHRRNKRIRIRIPHSHNRIVAMLQTLSNVNTNHIVRLLHNIIMLVVAPHMRLLPHTQRKRRRIIRLVKLAIIPFEILFRRLPLLQRQQVGTKHGATRLGESLLRIRRILLKKQPLLPTERQLLPIIPVFRARLDNIPRIEDTLPHRVIQQAVKPNLVETVTHTVSSRNHNHSPIDKRLQSSENLTCIVHKGELVQDSAIHRVTTTRAGNRRDSLQTRPIIKLHQRLSTILNLRQLRLQPRRQPIIPVQGARQHLLRTLLILRNKQPGSVGMKQSVMSSKRDTHSRHTDLPGLQRNHQLVVLNSSQNLFLIIPQFK